MLLPHEAIVIMLISVVLRLTSRMWQKQAFKRPARRMTRVVVISDEEWMMLRNEF